MDDVKVYIAAVAISLEQRLKEDVVGLLLTIPIAVALGGGARLFGLVLTSYVCYVVGGVIAQYIKFVANKEYENV